MVCSRIAICQACSLTVCSKLAIHGAYCLTVWAWVWSSIMDLVWQGWLSPVMDVVFVLGWSSIMDLVWQGWPSSVMDVVFVLGWSSTMDAVWECVQNWLSITDSLTGCGHDWSSIMDVIQQSVLSLCCPTVSCLFCIALGVRQCFFFSCSHSIHREWVDKPHSVVF